MRGRGHSSLVGFIVTAVIAVPSFAFVVQRTMEKDPQTKMKLTSSSGNVAITNSLDGQAILTAAPMLPGASTSGLVSLVNTGDGDEGLTLDSSAPVDTPGPGGGHLSTRLRLRVDDVSDGNAVVVYEGALDGLHLADLGTLRKDEQRTYRFVVTFPDGGANGADNAYQGSSATIGFTWTAAGAGPATPPASAPLSEQIAGDTPESYWPLDASQADMADVVGNNTGHWGTSVTTATGATPGGTPAAFFNGIDGYGYVASMAAPTQAYTMEAWVKPETTADAVILDHGGAGGLAISNGHFSFRQVDVTLRSSAAVVAGRWQQVVGTWDASSGRARLYVDGTLSAEADAPTAPSGSATFYIGRGSGAEGSHGSSARAVSGASGPGWFHGVMAQVAYFASALAGDRVTAHYNAGKVESSGGGSTGGGSTGGGDTSSGGSTGGGDTGSGASTGSGGSTGNGGSSGSGGSNTGGDGGTNTGGGNPPGGGIGDNVGNQTVCPGNVNAQGGTASERARKEAKAKARARAKAKALARARARKAAGKHGKGRTKARGQAATKKTRAKPKTRATCPGSRAKTATKKRGSG